MKLNTLVIATLALTFGACSSAEKKETAEPVAAAQAPQSASDIARQALADLAKELRFETNRDTLNPVAKNKLEALAQAMKAAPDLKLSIDGHTDSTGAEALNKSLSSRRARAVSAVLTQNGVAADRIAISGHADSSPVADNTTAQGRAANRRAEIKMN